MYIIYKGFNLFWPVYYTHDNHLTKYYAHDNHLLKHYAHDNHFA